MLFEYTGVYVYFLNFHRAHGKNVRFSCLTNFFFPIFFSLWFVAKVSSVHFGVHCSSIFERGKEIPTNLSLRFWNNRIFPSYFWNQSNRKNAFCFGQCKFVSVRNLLVTQGPLLLYQCGWAAALGLGFGLVCNSCGTRSVLHAGCLSPRCVGLGWMAGFLPPLSKMLLCLCLPTTFWIVSEAR